MMHFLVTLTHHSGSIISINHCYIIYSIMTNFKLIITLIWSIAWLANCVSHKKKDETIQKFHRTGVAIAVDHLIQKYEREHQKFYGDEIKDGDHLEWPALDGKNLINYCKKYLQHSVPGRNTGGITGSKIRKILHYEKQNTCTIHEVVIVQCKIVQKGYQLIYYMTRESDPNCVYSLKSRGCWSNFILTIVNKYCDFENKPLKNRPQKRKRADTDYTKHYRTGQPIAKDEYLLKYELEHQKLFNREGSDSTNHIDWPNIVEHPNLNFFCYQYMGECVPRRDRENVMGRRKIEKLQYQKSINKIVLVTTVTCQSNGASNLHLHITRALEKNCVYALLRQGNNVKSPLAIIFKHCNFEN